MRITDRLKKIKKLIGSEVIHSYQDEFFTPTKQTAKILDVHVFSLYDIQLLVEIEGVLSPLNTTKKYKVTRLENIPLIKIHLGKMSFPIYQCLNQKTKTIFVSKNDIDSSLIKDTCYSHIEDMEKSLIGLKTNISVKKNFLTDNPLRAIIKIYKVTEVEARTLRDIGLTPFGWRTNIDETFVFDPRFFNHDIVYDIVDSSEQAEKLSIYIGLLKLSKQKYKKQ